MRATSIGAGFPNKDSSTHAIPISKNLSGLSLPDEAAAQITEVAKLLLMEPQALLNELLRDLRDYHNQANGLAAALMGRCLARGAYPKFMQAGAKKRLNGMRHKAQAAQEWDAPGAYHIVKRGDDQ